MRRLLTAIAVLVCAALIAGPAYAGTLSGSAHDFTGEAWTTELCEACHTPHGADTSVADAPLWDHDVLGVTTYALYASVTLDASDLGQPSGVSKLCLSCHDGSIAVDSFGGTTGGATIDPAFQVGDSGTANTLASDHPVAFTYNDALAGTDGELALPSGGLALPLFGDKLECATCHDVHNTAAAGASLLRIDNAGSLLCLECHNK